MLERKQHKSNQKRTYHRFSTLRHESILTVNPPFIIILLIQAFAKAYVYQ